jgi:hypothetical protein
LAGSGRDEVTAEVRGGLRRRHRRQRHSLTLPS